MKNFLKYFWLNSKKLILFIFAMSLIVLWIGPNAYPFFFVLIIILTATITGDIIAFRNYQKTQSDIDTIKNSKL